MIDLVQDQPRYCFVFLIFLFVLFGFQWTFRLSTSSLIFIKLWTHSSLSWVCSKPKELVGPSGLEPPTSCLSGTRSNHLSYEPIWSQVWLPGLPGWWRWWDSNPWPPACRAGALPTELHPHIVTGSLDGSLKIEQRTKEGTLKFNLRHRTRVSYDIVSIERRWSSRTFRYGYLVTT